MPHPLVLAVLLTVPLVPGLVAAQEGERSLSLTIYSSADAGDFDPMSFLRGARGERGWPYEVPGLGVVRETRTLDLAQGEQDVDFTDVAAFVDPTTVRLEDLDQPDLTRVLEQGVLVDLIDRAALLDHHLGKNITIRSSSSDAGREIVGTLLSTADEDLIVQTPAGVEIFSGWNVHVSRPARPRTYCRSRRSDGGF